MTNAPRQVPGEVVEPLRISLHPAQGEIVELRIIGILDWSNFTMVESALGGVFDRHIYKVIVNLAQTKHISSTGFGCFISALDTASNQGGQLIFASTPPHILDVFRMLGLDKVLTFADTVEQAVGKF